MIRLYTPGHGIYIRDDDGRYYPVGRPPDGYAPTPEERRRFRELGR
jgi:hypothetical protein